MAYILFGHSVPEVLLSRQFYLPWNPLLHIDALEHWATSLFDFAFR